MEIKKIKNTKTQLIVVHPNKKIYKNKIKRIPTYIYNKLEIEKKISDSNKITQWAKLAGSIINGNKYINFDNNLIESKYSLNNHILYGCWSDDCNIITQDHFFDIQTVFDIYSKRGKPYTYTQCWMFATIFHVLCSLKKIRSRIIIGKNTKIDMNRNLVYDDGDGIWNFHVWNEIWFPEDKKWYSYDCCPGVSVDEKNIFNIGPVDISNKMNKYRQDYKYFKHLTTGENVETFTYKVLKKIKKKKYKLRKIKVLRRYQS